MKTKNCERTQNMVYIKILPNSQPMLWLLLYILFGFLSWGYHLNSAKGVPREAGHLWAFCLYSAFHLIPNISNGFRSVQDRSCDAALYDFPPWSNRPDTAWRCAKSHFPTKLKLDGIADPLSCFTVGPIWVGTILVCLGPNKSLVLVAFPQLWFLSSYLTIKICTVDVDICLRQELCIAFMQMWFVRLLMVFVSALGDTFSRLSVL